MATNLRVPCVLHCAGRLWRSVKAWFVSSLAACSLAGAACTEFSVTRSFRSNKTTEGEACLTHKELWSLCWGSLSGVIFQIKTLASTPCQHLLQGWSWKVEGQPFGPSNKLWWKWSLQEKSAVVGENQMTDNLGGLQARSTKEEQLYCHQWLEEHWGAFVAGFS